MTVYRKVVLVRCFGHLSLCRKHKKYFNEKIIISCRNCLCFGHWYFL